MLNSKAKKYRQKILAGSVIALSVAPGMAIASCGTAFCSINTQWDVQGTSMDKGTRVGLRFESIEQDRLHSGSKKVAHGQIPADHDEIKTENQNWLFSADHAINDSWGISVVIPYVDRTHEHIHDPQGAAEDESWDFAKLGDVRITGRYKPAENRPGMVFGVKLPTGDYDITNDDGEAAERTLQPGSGTIDGILGIFYGAHSLDAPSSWFVQASWQEALNERADYRPGHQLLLDGGYRYEGWRKAALMLQLNGVIREADSGDEAESDSSGGEFLFLSPGISVAVTSAIQVYGFVQLPLYQHVNGIQLTADSGIVVGVSGQL